MNFTWNELISILTSSKRKAHDIFFVVKYEMSSILSSTPDRQTMLPKPVFIQSENTGERNSSTLKLILDGSLELFVVDVNKCLKQIKLPFLSNRTTIKYSMSKE